MPKDWDNHKAEIERLYMVEHRPLKDVRNILRMQHAFDASVRSYRMKLDEWRMWKNNSKNERRRTKTISRHRQPRTITVSESLKEASSSREPISALPPPVDISGSTQSDFIYGISIPQGSLDIAELLPMLSSLCSHPQCALDIMLMKWTSDGSYLAAALKFLRENKAAFRIEFPTLLGGSIFRCINENVASHEKYPFAKMCLEIDFEQAQHENRENRGPIPDWMRPWREACAAQSWKDVKKYLSGLDSDIDANLLFALPFLAEQLLQKNLHNLEHWRDRGGLMTISGANECLQESMEILDTFHSDELDIDPLWYKRFLQLKRPDGLQVWDYKHLDLNQLQDYRQKFSQLKVLHDSAYSTDGLVSNLLNAATVLKESKVILDTIQCEDVPLTNNDLSPQPSTPIMVRGSHKPCNELRMLLKEAYENWGIGHDIRQNVYCLLRHLNSLGISNPLNPEENVFILISQTIPPNNQVSFTMEVLKAITGSWCQLPIKEFRHDWDTWVAVRDSSTLESLTEILAKKIYLLYEITLSLDDRMQPVVVKLILDAFAGLFGEYVLWGLKDIIKQRHASGQPYSLPLFYYKSILDTLNHRNMKVNQDLFAFLGRLLLWKGIDENGDEDEKECRFFETSDDESNDSESESLEPENESEDQ